MTVPLPVDQIASLGRPTLALASSNSGKIAEFQAILGDDVTIMSLPDFGLESPEETGSTFEENAVLKARFLHDQTGLVTLADDSGLEVDALGGAPGVYSARFAGDHHNDADNRALLLRKLGEFPDQPRTARFVAVIAIVDGDGHLTLSRGTCEGTIARVARGTGGFGYDPLFELPDGRTMAQLDGATKNTLSHRARAMRQAMPALRVALGLPQQNEIVNTP